MFTYFKELCREVKVQSNLDILSSSLWCTDKLFFPDWSRHGVHSIGDVINTYGIILSQLEIKNRSIF